MQHDPRHVLGHAGLMCALAGWLAACQSTSADPSQSPESPGSETPIAGAGQGGAGAAGGAGAGQGAAGSTSVAGAGGGAAGAPDGTGGTAASADAGVVAPGDGSVATSCAPSSLPAGDHSVSISFAGKMRDYILHVPAGLPAQPVPLVLSFHGYGGYAEGQIAWTQMNVVANREGFVVAYPNGFGIARSWNAGACCGEALLNNLDDVGLTRAIVADIERQLCIDERRVYATGFSNGGMFSHRLACEASDLFAAVAPVSGQIGIASNVCAPARPIPLLHIHGTGDTVAPYNGGASPAAPGATFPSVAETIATWVSKNACTDSAAMEYLRNGTAHCERYSACAAGVTVSLCMLDGMGHCWPGNPDCLGFGQATTDLNGSEEIWSFLKQARLP